MTIIYKSLLVILFLSSTEFAFAKANEDHLEPVRNIYDMEDYQIEYYSKIRKILFKGLDQEPIVRFQIYPSFSPENVLQIEYDKRNSKYYLVYHDCDEMIWMNEKWDSLKAKESKKIIDKESVELINSLFDIAISQTKLSKGLTGGLDGEVYYFSTRNYGFNTGKIWSPAEDTKMGKLVHIGNELIKLANSKNESVMLDNALKKKIESLIEEFKLSQSKKG